MLLKYEMLICFQFSILLEATAVISDRRLRDELENNFHSITRTVLMFNGRAVDLDAKERVLKKYKDLNLTCHTNVEILG